MTQAVQQFLAVFDSLTEDDKHVAAVEVLRRAWPDGVPAISDESLLSTADALFLDLDRREAADAGS